MIPMEI